jgi:membrane protein
MGLVSTYAAALSFYFVLSLVPFLVVSTTIINQISPFDLTTEFGEILKTILPPTSGLDSSSIVEAAKMNADNGFKTIGFLLAVWTSTGFMTMLFSALHLIFDSKHRTLPPSGLLPQLKSLILLFIWMNTLLLTAFCFIFSVLLQKDMMETFFHPWVATTSGWIMRDLSVFVILAIAFMLTYLVISPPGVSLRLHIQGATFSAMGWIIISYIFADVLPLVWQQNVLYGALGSIVATLLWAYSCAWSVLIGACWASRFSVDWE